MAAGDGWIKVWPVHQVFCLLAWLTLHHQSPLKHLHYSRYSNKKLTHITLHFLWLVSKTPRYLNLLGSLLTLEPEAAIYCFPPAAICLYTLVMDGKWDKPLDTGTTPPSYIDLCPTGRNLFWAYSIFLPRLNFWGSFKKACSQFILR